MRNVASDVAQQLAAIGAVQSRSAAPSSRVLRENDEYPIAPRTRESADRSRIRHRGEGAWARVLSRGRVIPHDRPRIRRISAPSRGPCAGWRQVDNDTRRGIIDGANATFTVAFTPIRERASTSTSTGATDAHWCRPRLRDLRGNDYLQRGHGSAAW